MSAGMSSTESLGVVRDVAQNVTARHAASDDQQARWPSETMEALGNAGVMGLMAASSAGGVQAGMQGLAPTTEQLTTWVGRVLLNLPLL